MAGRMFEMLAEQLLAASERDFAPRGSRLNPNPPGSIWPGSSTEAVLSFLRARPGAWYTRCQVITATGRPNSNVNHALNFLVATGQVRTAPDGQRNPRYLRYSIPKEAL